MERGGRQLVAPNIRRSRHFIGPGNKIISLKFTMLTGAFAGRLCAVCHSSGAMVTGMTVWPQHGCRRFERFLTQLSEGRPVRRFAQLMLGAGLLAGALCTAPAAASGGIVAGIPGFLNIASLLGPAPLNQPIHLVVHLAYPNPGAVAAYAQAVNNPASPSFGNYLTPSAFTTSFGPSPQSYSTVEYIVGSFGMQIVQEYANRKVFDVVGTVGQAELLFGTLINQYSLNNVVYYANGLPTTLPLALGGTIAAVTPASRTSHCKSRNHKIARHAHGVRTAGARARLPRAHRAQPKS